MKQSNKPHHKSAPWIILALSVLCLIGTHFTHELSKGIVVGFGGVFTLVGLLHIWSIFRPLHERPKWSSKFDEPHMSRISLMIVAIFCGTIATKLYLHVMEREYLTLEIALYALVIVILATRWRDMRKWK